MYKALAFTLLLVNLSYSCPVCFNADSKTRLAYYITTGILIFLPLLMLAGGVLYLRKLQKTKPLK